VGGYWLGSWFTGLYTGALDLPLKVTSLNPVSLVVAPTADVVAAALAAWGSGSTPRPARRRRR
jgi:hypothetical protein